MHWLTCLLANIAVILQTDWLLLSCLRESLSVPDSSKGLPIYMENNSFPIPCTGTKLCLIAKVWGFRWALVPVGSDRR